jgi:hypothetical protein
MQQRAIASLTKHPETLLEAICGLNVIDSLS